jgi:hypothetical protein
MPNQSQAVRRLRRFKPGHLVTDQDLNLFVEAIKDLDRRLAAVEAALQKRSSGKK